MVQTLSQYACCAVIYVSYIELEEMCLFDKTAVSKHSTILTDCQQPASKSTPSETLMVSIETGRG